MTPKTIKLMSPAQHREHDAATTLNRRIASIYRGQKARAAKELKEREPAMSEPREAQCYMLDYSSEWLHDFVLRTIGASCPCCKTKLTVANFVLDHRTPIARGGSFASDNLCVMAKRCNLLKGGVMDGAEFMTFKGTIESLLPRAVVDDIYRRMRLGSNAMSANQRFTRKAKA